MLPPSWIFWRGHAVTCQSSLVTRLHGLSEFSGQNSPNSNFGMRWKAKFLCTKLAFPVSWICMCMNGCQWKFLHAEWLAWPLLKLRTQQTTWRAIVDAMIKLIQFKSYNSLVYYWGCGSINLLELWINYYYFSNKLDYSDDSSGPQLQ